MAQVETISSLPNTVLIKIFQQLHTFQLLKCKGVCRWWRDIINTYIDIFLTTVSMFDVSEHKVASYLTDENLKHVFLSSKKIFVMDLFRCYRIIGTCWMSVLAKEKIPFTFLQYINIAHTSVINENLDVLLDSAASVQELYMNDCSNLNDEILPALKKCTGLRVLSLPANISAEEIPLIAASLPNLKMLDLDGIIMFNETFVQLVDSIISTLEELVVPYSLLSENSLSYCVKKISSLKFICICHCGIHADKSTEIAKQSKYLTICNLF